jgi:hypothetical protein
MVHQCGDCDSEGELYETVENNVNVSDNINIGKLH